jgi:hypothetical protein
MEEAARRLEEMQRQRPALFFSRRVDQRRARVKDVGPALAQRPLSA